MTVTEIEDVEAGPRRGGRPTRAEAARREAHLIAVATTLFLERGFDATSIYAVAEAAGMSKPTVYARYRDKRALFEAVLRERIAAWLAPLSAAARALPLTPFCAPPYNQQQPGLRLEQPSPTRRPA